MASLVGHGQGRFSIVFPRRCGLEDKLASERRAGSRGMVPHLTNVAPANLQREGEVRMRHYEDVRHRIASQR
jgi:hypothetical protein